MNKNSFTRTEPMKGVKPSGKSMTRPTPLKTIRQMLGDAIRSGIPLDLYDSDGVELSDQDLEDMYIDPTLDKVEVEILSADVKAEITKYYSQDVRKDESGVSDDDARSSEASSDAGEAGSDS